MFFVMNLLKKYYLLKYLNVLYQYNDHENQYTYEDDAGDDGLDHEARDSDYDYDHSYDCASNCDSDCHDTGQYDDLNDGDGTEATRWV